MKNPAQRTKVFIGTGVLIAGVASAPGASATVLDLCEAEIAEMVISRQVLIEADRNFSCKLPGLVTQFCRFIQSLAPVMVEDPPIKAVEKAANLIDRKDATIGAAAPEAKIDYLISLDKKHFLKQKVQRSITIEDCAPTDFLRIFERLWLYD